MFTTFKILFWNIDRKLLLKCELSIIENIIRKIIYLYITFTYIFYIFILVNNISYLYYHKQNFYIKYIQKITFLVFNKIVGYINKA